MILVMVAIGGVTRLTESGLSIVDWRPLMGVIPPLNEASWTEKYDQYKQYPEYQVLKPKLELSDFKSLYVWEYVHRLMGRVLGIAFLIPFSWFLIRGRLTKKLSVQLGYAFVLGGAQGLLGWFMVKSGLHDNPYVSHYRLAAHLTLAFMLFGYLLWIVLGLIKPVDAEPPKRSLRPLKSWGYILTGLIFLQIVYGAFVAGLNAGYMFNTFPKMLGKWVPPGFWRIELGWLNLFENVATVQFIHRTLAWILVLGVGAFWLYSKTFKLQPYQRTPIHWLGAIMGLQFMLGIMTLIGGVPIVMAVLHQVMACVLLGAVTVMNRVL